MFGRCMAMDRSGLVNSWRMLTRAAPFVSLLVALAVAAWALLPGGPAVAGDGGQGWVEVTPPGTMGSALALATAGRNVAWAGFSRRTEGSPFLVGTVNGGAEWTRREGGLDLPESVRFFDLSAADENDVWACYGYWVYHSTTGGLAWEKKYEGYGTAHLSAFPYRVSAQSGGVAFMLEWLVGSGYDHFFNNMQIKKITPQGLVSVPLPFMKAGEVPPGAFPVGPQDIEPVDESTLWWCGVDYDPTYPDEVIGVVYRSTDGGTTWERSEIPQTFLMAACPLDASNAWVVGYRYASYPQGPYVGVILRTTDGGKTWHEQLVVEGLAIVDVSAADGNVAWVAGATTADILLGRLAIEPAVEKGGIFRTTDGGRTWEKQLEFEGGYIAEVCAVDQVTAWAAGKGPSGDPLVLRTEDGGDPRPDLASISPEAAPVGSVITLRGRDFGEVQGSSQVLFGSITAEEYVAWTGEEIRVKVPEGVEGVTEVTVQTPEGCSNPLPFRSMGTFRVDTVSPGRAFQHTLGITLELAGNGFLPGCWVRMEKDGRAIEALSCTAWSETRLGAAFSLFGADPGVYDLVITNPGGQEIRLPSAFTVDPVCGSGSGTALLILGLTTGLVLASSWKRRRDETELQ
ncbi:MAG: IPT/TIG domain-containing protein [Candidatus Geothermincolales bacterium]